jgi:hypothetical protein
MLRQKWGQLVSREFSADTLVRQPGGTARASRLRVKPVATCYGVEHPRNARIFRRPRHARQPQHTTYHER